MTSPDRDRALTAFAQLVEMPPVTRLIQIGRERASAHFRFELTDKRIVDVGTIDDIYSYATVRKAALVALGISLKHVRPTDWQSLLGVLIAHATDVLDDETITQRVADYLGTYSDRAAHERNDEVLADREPFLDDNTLWLSADHLGKWLRVTHGQRDLDLHTIRRALTDLDGTRQTFNYRSDGHRSWTTTSYYGVPLPNIGIDRNPDLAL